MKECVLKEYELTVLLRPNLSKEEAEATVSSIKGEITQRGGELTDETSRGLLGLAYTITIAGNKYQEGNHQLLRFVVSPDKIVGIESRLNISEDILRFKIVRYQEIPIPTKKLPPGAKAAPKAEAKAAPKAEAEAAPKVEAEVAAPKVEAEAAESKSETEVAEPKAEDESKNSGETSGESAEKGS